MYTIIIGTPNHFDTVKKSLYTQKVFLRMYNVPSSNRPSFFLKTTLQSFKGHSQNTWTHNSRGRWGKTTIWGKRNNRSCGRNFYNFDYFQYEELLLAMQLADSTTT
uniref:(northern house mosquito) hypothetical protein n=1 Tax=Culex pipiens TaxID=7175 RepID=A0A8D8MYP2_CULPI